MRKQTGKADGTRNWCKKGERVAERLSGKRNRLTEGRRHPSSYQRLECRTIALKELARIAMNQKG